jgi:hypothetical protein
MDVLISHKVIKYITRDKYFILKNAIPLRSHYNLKLHIMPDNRTLKYPRQKHIGIIKLK